MILQTARERQFNQALDLHKKGLSTRQIGRKIGIHHSTVWAWTTTNGNGMQPARINHCDYTPILQQYLDGLLLGDGCLILRRHHRSQSPAYTQGFATRRREWGDCIQTKFNELGLVSRVDIYHSSCLQKPTVLGCHSLPPKGNICHLRTLAYYELGLAYERWYPNGHKLVPKDLTLTPDILLNWYLGDGWISQDSKTGHYRIGLCTHGFTEDDVAFLAGLLQQELGIRTVNLMRHSTSYKGVPKVEIRISGGESVVQFLQYMAGLHIPRCFEYKFVAQYLVPESWANICRRRAWTTSAMKYEKQKEQLQLVYALHGQGCIPRLIAKEIGVKECTVRSWLRNKGWLWKAT